MLYTVQERQPDVPFGWQDMASISEGKQEDGGTELSPPVFAMRQGMPSPEGFRLVQIRA